MARSAPLKRVEAWLSFVLASVFILCQTLVQTTLAGLWGPGVASACMAGSLLAIVGAVAITVIQGQLLPLVAFVATAFLLIFQCYLFGNYTGAPVKPNILFSYLTMLAFPLFAVRGLPLNRVFLFLFAVSLIYCAVYVLRYEQFIESYRVAAAAARRLTPRGAIVVDSGVRVLPGDAARDLRVYLAGAFTTFALFYSLVRLRTRFQLRWLLSLALAGAAIGMSMSRTYTGVVLLVTVAYLVRLTHRPHRFAFAGLFLAMALVIVSGMAIETWNPFALMASDDSAAVRARAYDVLCHLLRDRFVLGIGIPSNTAVVSDVIGLPSVFPADLGTLGVWFTFGLLGLFLFCAEVVLMMIGPSRPADLSVENHRTLVLSGLVAGLGSWLSPDIWGGSSGIVAGITLGLVIRQRTRTFDPALWFGGERGRLAVFRRTLVARARAVAGLAERS